MSDLALFEVNSPEIPDSSTVKESLSVAAVEVGMTVPGEIGPAVVIGLQDTHWRFSDIPARKLRLRDVQDGYEYRSMYSLDHVMRVAADVGVRRWMVGLEPLAEVAS